MQMDVPRKRSPGPSFVCFHRNITLNNKCHTSCINQQTGPQITTVGGDIQIKVPEDRRVIVREGDNVINVGAIASDAAA